jgi:flagellar P-ring protein precursor FlgI
MPKPIRLARCLLLTVVMLLVSCLWLTPATADASTDSFVIGTGLVIGLAGTGDSQVDEVFIRKTIIGVLRKAGLDPWRGEIAPGRIAKVVIAAELPAEPGTPLRISVMPAGDATSLAGGTLLPTPMRYTNGGLHSVTQGRIQIDGQSAFLDSRPQQSSVIAAAGGAASP